MGLLPKDSDQGYQWVKRGILIIAIGIVAYQFLFAPKIEHKATVDDMFAYDGSYYPLQEEIKKNMNDPDSYEHIETTRKYEGNYILLNTKFRGKNAFGAKVIQQATATVDKKDGHIIDLKTN